MHYEQRWLDLVPALFGDVYVLLDPAYHVGHWNLRDRAVPSLTMSSSSTANAAGVRALTALAPWTLLMRVASTPARITIAI
jgi:hypothetical protein